MHIGDHVKREPLQCTQIKNQSDLDFCDRNPMHMIKHEKHVENLIVTT